jgi:hypothetical protein
MEKEIKKITPEEIEKKRVKLSEELNKEVYAHCFETEKGEQIIGFFKNPDRLVKMRALDMSLQSWTNSADILLKTSLITEHSDSRIMSESSENDTIYFSFLLKANELVKFYSEQQKKS